eukprot:1143247-Pelagomonas_calceolata.AAC.19
MGVVAGLEGMLRAPPRGFTHSPLHLVAYMPTALQPPLSSPPECASPAEVSSRALSLGLKACCARPEGPALMEQAGLLQPVVVAGSPLMEAGLLQPVVDGRVAGSRTHGGRAPAACCGRSCEIKCVYAMCCALIRLPGPAHMEQAGLLQPVVVNDQFGGSGGRCFESMNSMC